MKARSKKTTPPLNLAEVLKTLLELRTAPFREGYVLDEIQRLLRAQRIPFFEDASGNIVAGVSQARQLRGAKPWLALQAHTDHPGFHVTTTKGARSQARWLGGAPFKDWIGAHVFAVDPDVGPEPAARGRILQAEDPTSTREGVVFEIEWDRPVKLGPQSFGAFDLPGHELRGDLLASRAADDLAGCATALVALDHARRMGASRGLALFTRAEEVGFVGCLEVMKYLPKNVHTITLEASRALPLAEIGQGVVLRLGDRSSVYDSDLGIWMWRSAEELKKQNIKFVYQRRSMDGGSCEASAFSRWGYKASGLAVPLGNYHNQSETGRPEPEIISPHDVDTATQLCTFLLTQFPKGLQVGRDFRKAVEKSARSLRPLLKKGKSFA